LTKRPYQTTVFCRTKQWPLPQYYAVCPYCHLTVEPKLHPEWPGKPDECYAPPIE
jgi:hypothetical protein